MLLYFKITSLFARAWFFIETYNNRVLFGLSKRFGSLMSSSLETRPSYGVNRKFQISPTVIFSITTLPPLSNSHSFFSCSEVLERVDVCFVCRRSREKYGLVEEARISVREKCHEILIY